MQGSHLNSFHIILPFCLLFHCPPDAVPPVGVAEAAGSSDSNPALFRELILNIVLNYFVGDVNSNLGEVAENFGDTELEGNLGEKLSHGSY